ncbi:hypothetical protein PVAP13_9KG610500 [Panicum virgatum]|uniref:F-box domain-containing protein n=1 Tax=Panicum virgatum TaxID=38727 RepID=A0A8T0NYD5_PANVG|nr:hypothetical protein PVAP13_9KG610500 [Panicum virgatum]
MMLEGQSYLVSRSLPSSCEPETEWAYLADQVLSGKRPAPEDVEEADGGGKRSKPPSPQPHTPDITEGHGSSRHASGGGEPQGTGSNPINSIGRDLTINCLLRLSRSDYGSVASLSRDFRSLVRSGEIYRLRRQNGVAEHWVYFSCNVLEWDAYDPYRDRWIRVPKMPPDECFMCSDKESLAVGTDSLGTILSSAEMYDSESHTWTPLPSMNRARKMCSGVFMDGKFYVIGGVANNNKVLTCGEEYDMKRRSWRIIENMSEGLNGVTGAPPLIAVVNNELYAADYSEKDLKKYDKKNNKWITLGKLPERSVSMNGWGLAFRACGDRLIVIGGPRTYTGGTIELNSWVPNDRPPVWNMIARRPSGNFVYNCAVMGC